MNLHLLRLVWYKITLMEEIKRRKTPKKPGPGCLTGGWRYPQNESIYTYKCCDNIQPYPLVDSV